MRWFGHVDTVVILISFITSSIQAENVNHKELHISVELGETIVLPCEADANPPALKWMERKAGGPISMYDMHQPSNIKVDNDKYANFQIDTNNVTYWNLTIVDADAHDGGTYECQTLKDGKASIFQYHVDVIDVVPTTPTAPFMPITRLVTSTKTSTKEKPTPATSPYFERSSKLFNSSGTLASTTETKFTTVALDEDTSMSMNVSLGTTENNQHENETNSSSMPMVSSMAKVSASFQETSKHDDSIDIVVMMIIAAAACFGLSVTFVLLVYAYFYWRAHQQKEYDVQTRQRNDNAWGEMVAPSDVLRIQDYFTFLTDDASNKLGWVEDRRIEQNDASQNKDSLNYLNVPEKTDFPIEKLRRICELGEGSFGKVFLAEADGLVEDGVKTIVAVKTSSDAAFVPGAQESMLREIQIMQQIKPHPNVVSFIALSMNEITGPLLIMEYASRGNLRDFLMESRGYDNVCKGELDSCAPQLSFKQLMIFCTQITCGMTFVSSQEFIHRDLAARNILLTGDLVCKIADFGLARDIMNTRIYRRTNQACLPIRWMAPESLQDDIYTTRSDVWSFGVLLWEIITLGSSPYPGFSLNQVMQEVNHGYRMPKPDGCKQEIYDIMSICWRPDPAERPSFKDLFEYFDKLVSDQSGYSLIDGFEMEEHHIYSV